MNDLTHTTMHELFGLTDTTMMVHVSRMARAERVVSATGVDEYLPHMERLGRPVTLMSGQDNLVWVPESTERTYSAIANALGTEQVRRVVVDGYGHQDIFIGANAARDTFPHVLAHLERSGA
jgi:cholesterol oxidase